MLRRVRELVYFSCYDRNDSRYWEKMDDRSILKIMFSPVNCEGQMAVIKSTLSYSRDAKFINPKVRSYLSVKSCHDGFNK